MKRQIEDKLFTYIDERLTNHGLAQHYITERNPRALFQVAAETLVGIREHGGNNRGPLVELIQETLGGADREAWCMAMVQSLLAYVERKLNVVSPIFASEHCLTVWSETPTVQRVRLLPSPGAIVIWQHGNTDSGHTGVLVEVVTKDDRMEVIEGNTESGVVGGKVERDGGGVYITSRDFRKTGNMVVVGFLKPF